MADEIGCHKSNSAIKTVCNNKQNKSGTNKKTVNERESNCCLDIEIVNKANVSTDNC